MTTRSGMKYRWRKHGEDGYDESYVLYLILDGRKYEFADVSWNFNIEKWKVFVSGFVSDDSLDIERPYELLCDAKADVMNYANVWWVSGVFQRMSADEKKGWQELGS